MSTPWHLDQKRGVAVVRDLSLPSDRPDVLTATLLLRGSMAVTQEVHDRLREEFTANIVPIAETGEHVCGWHGARQQLQDIATQKLTLAAKIETLEAKRAELLERRRLAEVIACDAELRSLRDQLPLLDTIAAETKTAMEQVSVAAFDEVSERARVFIASATAAAERRLADAFKALPQKLLADIVAARVEIDLLQNGTYRGQWLKEAGLAVDPVFPPPPPRPESPAVMGGEHFDKRQAATQQMAR